MNQKEFNSEVLTTIRQLTEKVADLQKQVNQQGKIIAENRKNGVSLKRV